MAYIGKQPSDITRAIATYDTFTGDGSTATFDLTQAAASANDIVVVVNNVRQEPGSSKSYTLGLDGSGITKRVTFNVAPEAADDIYVVNPTQIEAIVRAGDVSSGAITGQTLVSATAAADNILIYDVSATALGKITNTTLTKGLDITGQTELATIAADDDLLLIYDTSATTIKKIQKSNIATTLTYTAGSATGDGSTTAFTINSGRAVADVFAIVNGIVMVPTDDYTISSTTLTFALAPSASAEIQFRYLPI
jgi:hypothetical protein